MPGCHRTVAGMPPTWPTATTVSARRALAEHELHLDSTRCLPPSARSATTGNPGRIHSNAEQSVSGESDKSNCRFVEVFEAEPHTRNWPSPTNSGMAAVPQPDVAKRCIPAIGGQNIRSRVNADVVVEFRKQAHFQNLDPDRNLRSVRFAVLNLWSLLTRGLGDVRQRRIGSTSPRLAPDRTSGIRGRLKA